VELERSLPDCADQLWSQREVTDAPASTRRSCQLTDSDFKFTYPDGRTEEFHKKAGEFLSAEEPWEYLPENLANERFEALIIELKN
jgi:hypothetical protein